MQIIGCQVRREPPSSTGRYTRWINQLAADQLLTQVLLPPPTSAIGSFLSPCVCPPPGCQVLTGEGTAFQKSLSGREPEPEGGALLGGATPKAGHLEAAGLGTGMHCASPRLSELGLSWRGRGRASNRTAGEGCSGLGPVGRGALGVHCGSPKAPGHRVGPVLNGVSSHTNLHSSAAARQQPHDAA